ncbi:electron transport protein SCO1/SenC [Beggiatoa sp. PS]|nr:electron transport protein SCO1/SenC [Beggiatoa sp. PS]
MTPKKISEILLSVGIGAIVFGAVWMALQFRYTPEPPAFPLALDTNATVLSEPLAVPTFTLTDQQNSPFTEKELRGHWSFLFFGYTYCPDICPTTLAILAQVDKLLLDKKVLPHPRVIFVSVDPLRDTPQKLANYVAYFNPAFLGITGEEEQLQILTRPLGIAYQRSPGTETSENYLIDHSASILLVNPQGQVQAIVSPPHQPATIAEDYQKILAAVAPK